MRFLFVLLIYLAWCCPSFAEDVDVKYRDNDVSLENFDCPNIKESSFVNRICYDSANLYLVVLLKSTYYHYCNIPPAMFSEWVSAPSLGRYYNGNIKGNFSCEGQEVPQY
jgi:hypothetical protein